MTSVERFTTDITKHPSEYSYAKLLQTWERAYEDKQKSPTPEHLKRFQEVDELVKSITVIVDAALLDLYKK
jgi:hypothetical protein